MPGCRLLEDGGFPLKHVVINKETESLCVLDLHLLIS
jgi:hypothetical protein